MMERALRILAVSLAAALAVGCSGEVSGEGEDDEASASDVSELKGKDVYRFKVISHNIAGAMLNKGAPEAIDYAVAQINDFHPDVVLLQEVCETQSNAFKQRLPGWTVHYEHTYMHPDCGSLGHLIASPYPMAKAPVVDLKDPFPTDPKAYKALCGNVAVPNRKGIVHACTTHLISTGSDKSLRDETEKARTKQVLQLIDGVKSHLNDNDPVILGGDFNAGPSRELMDPLYRVTRDGTMNGPGAFDEADQTDAKREGFKEPGVTCAQDACRSGENTHKKSKLDHIFFSHGRVAGEISGDVGSVGKSDHQLYRASAQLKLKKQK